MYYVCTYIIIIIKHLIINVTSYVRTSISFLSGFDFAATKAKIIANYVEITDLPVNLILQELLDKKVILSRQMEIIEAKSLQSERMEYILDRIILPSLEMEISTYFNSLLDVMEKSDDEKFTSMAQKLGMYVRTYARSS